MDHAIIGCGAGELAALLAAGELSAVECVRAHLERMDELDPLLHAVVAARPEAALAEAADADARRSRREPLGPLHGLPFTAKDWLDTRDLPCTGGLAQFAGRQPKHDATVVARMRAAGAILLAKTKPGVDDVLFARANNPYDPARTPGGSSSGEAALIAACGSPLGLGSDSGGSLRWPAHCCGVATLKPTSGLVPRTGHFPRIYPMADPRTVIGPLARRVEDLALVLPLIAGTDGLDSSAVPVAPGDPRRVEARGLRVAVHTTMPGASVTPETAAAVISAARTLQEAGAVVDEATPPRLEESLSITLAYWARVRSVSLTEWEPAGIGLDSAEEVERNLFEWDRFRRDVLRWMQAYDAVLCPAAERPAPLHGEPIGAQEYLFTLPWSLTGQPAVVVRAGSSPEGLPIGVQIVGRMFEDATVLALGKAVESTTGGWRPPVIGASPQVV